MADYDQSGLPVEFVKTLRNLTHRDMDGSLKLRKLEFGRLANIEKYDPVGVRFVWPAAAKLFGREFRDDRHATPAGLRGQSVRVAPH